MASNLTRDEARDRAHLLDVESYRVELDLTGGDTTFRSVTTVSFRCTRPGASTFIELSAPAVREITLNGAQVSLDRFDGDRIALDGLAEGNELVVTADCAYSRSGEGLHRFTDPADGGVYMYSDLETFDAHRIYACFDQPDLKATFQFEVTAEQKWQVISNMAPASTAPTQAQKSALACSRPPRCCRPTSPRSRPARTMPCATSMTASRSASSAASRWPPYLDADEIFEVTKQGFDYFHDAFGVRYPFGKFDQLFVPEFKAGAMENAGCVTFREDVRLPVEGDRRLPSPAPRRSCTSWRTCGSATWSPCGGGTTCG